MIPTLRILIIDDDERMTHTLADILTLAGYEVEKALSGEEALEKVMAQEFGCVLTDIRMPGMNGVEMHQILRQSRPGLPVVIMTAYAGDDLVRTALEEGVVGVLDKPLDIHLLLSFFASLAKSRSIAIVDDDPLFCKTLGDILQQRGFDVHPFTDPHTNCELIGSNAQIILLDLKLNSVIGLDVLRDIRRLYPSLPVLMMTAYRQEMAESIKAAYEIDAYACLYKPLAIVDLLEKLAEIQTMRLRKVLNGK